MQEDFIYYITLQHFKINIFIFSCSDRIFICHYSLDHVTQMLDVPHRSVHPDLR